MTGTAIYRAALACIVLGAAPLVAGREQVRTAAPLVRTVSDGDLARDEAARAARLPRVDIEKPRHAIGKGTKEAIQSGVVYGYAGQVDGIVGRLREELGEEATTIATGGYAAAIVPFCDQVDEVDDLLTLSGLKLIWERNK